KSGRLPLPFRAAAILVCERRGSYRLDQPGIARAAPAARRNNGFPLIVGVIETDFHPFGADRLFQSVALWIRFTAAIKTGEPSAQLFSIFRSALPLFFVRDQGPIFFAQSGDLQFVAVGIGKINASFAGCAQTVLGAKIALIGAAAGRD